MSAESAFAILKDRPPVAASLQLDPPPTVNLPVPVPVKRPPVPAKDLFTLMVKLDRGIDHSISVRGKGDGRTVAGAVRDTQYVWGWGYALAGASGMAYAVGIDDPLPFIMGAALSGASLFGIYHLTNWIDRKLRATPAPVKLAEPFLEAFKNGESATQALVTNRARRWADALNSGDIAGQDLRQQLRELANVRVEVDAETQRRLDIIDSIVALLPRKKSDSVYGGRIASQLELLDGDDRAEVASLLLARLYDGEKLIGKQTSAADAERLYAALIVTQPGKITNRDVLQKFVTN